MAFVAMGQTLWAVLVLVAAIGLAVAMVAVTLDFIRRRERLPEATRYEDLKEQNTKLEVHKLDLEAKAREIEQRIQDRDRVAAEVAALTERLASIRSELEGLPGAERQIDQMKQLAADTAAEFARESAKLEEIKLHLAEAASALTRAQDQHDRLTDETEVLEARNRELRETLPEEIDLLRKTMSSLDQDKRALSEQIAQMKGERDGLFAARDEAAALAMRIEALKVQLAGLPEEVERAHDLLSELRAEVADLTLEVTDLKSEKLGLLAARDEAVDLTARSAFLRQAIETATAERDDMLVRLDEAHQAHQAISDEIQTLKANRASLEQQAEVTALMGRQATLEAEIGALQGGATPSADIAADLKGLPSCLVATPTAAFPAQREDEALHDVAVQLEKLGLRYSRRTLYAFHTALKINEASQMTVLAGVSGTGKSLLPRRYAEAMGLNFLQIAVEPRWDSPQDLLGFYNYIEKRYRATELARALVQMDPYDTSKFGNKGHGNQMMLVLLDEMNLARVEYYFSEFLSRLEVRPRMAEVADEELRRGAWLPIDIPGRADGAINLFPSHNVLFAGTMNDDESTQALSDKVLDRSNVMQFAAPGDFKTPDLTQPSAPMRKHRSFNEWQHWIRAPERLEEGDRGKARDVIKKLAEIMERCGRPFGHRLNEAILAYTVNYPRAKGDPITLPLADQVELRILPKLRGLPIEDHQQALDDLARIIGDDLGDRPFADRLKDLIDRQLSGTRQFNWRGFNRD